MQEKVKIFKIITVAAIIFIVFLATAMIINFVKIAKANNRQNELEAELARLTARYESNAEEIDYKQTEEYITYYARKELGMKRKDETVFTRED